MKNRNMHVIALLSMLALCGCSPEKPVANNPPPQEQAAINQADREKIRLLVKEMQTVAVISDKAFEILGQEAKALVTGEKKSVELAALLDKTKSELLAAGSGVAAKALPEGLPAGIRKNFQEAKDALIKAGQMKGESLDIMKRLVEEKKPGILLEYRSKLADASKQLEEAMKKLKEVQAAAGI